VTPQVAHGGTKDAGGPKGVAGGTDQPSGKDGEEAGGEEASAGGEEASAGGEDPSPEKDSAAESGENNTGAGEASAGGGGSNSEEGSGDGQGDDKDGGDGDAEMAVGVEHATVELNEKGECKRDPEFWALPLKLPIGGSVYLERFKEAVEKGSKEGTSPTADEIIEPPAFLKPRKVSGRLHPARWAQMGHTEAENFLCTWGVYTSALARVHRPPSPRSLPRGNKKSSTSSRRS
jgi:hypothetical protein